MNCKRFLLIFLLLFSGLLSGGAEESLLERINRLREKEGALPLKEDSRLHLTGETYAAALFNSRKLSHKDSQDRRGLERYREAGGTALVIGEILGTGPGTEEILKAWMKSPSHKEVLLSGEWTHTGWGLISTENGCLWVLLFTTHLLAEPECLFRQGQWTLRGPYEGKDPVLKGASWEKVDFTVTDGEYRFLLSPEQGEGIFYLGYYEKNRFIKTHLIIPAKQIKGE